MNWKGSMLAWKQYMVRYQCAMALNKIEIYRPYATSSAIFELICQVCGDCSYGWNKIGILWKHKSSIRLFGKNGHSPGRGANLAPFQLSVSSRRVMWFYTGIEYIETNWVEIKFVVGGRNEKEEQVPTDRMRPKWDLERTMNQVNSHFAQSCE